MKELGVESIPRKRRVLNAVALRNAVLCAECDVVSDSPHDTCLVCGSRSLLNIARMFGGNLPKDRASLTTPEVLQMAPREIVLTFPSAHRLRKKATVESLQTRRTALDDNGIDEVECGVLCGPKS
jgi:hypothetical protein